MVESIFRSINARIPHARTAPEMRWPMPGTCVLLTLFCLVSSGINAWAAESSPLTVEIKNAGGASLLAKSDPKTIDLTYTAAYAPGDEIVVGAPTADHYLVIQVDDKVPQSMVYLPNGKLEFAIPFEKLATAYDPKAFSGTTHHITARVADPAEISTYRNVALNSLDQREVSDCFPHATASSVTRNDPVFFERNAIDGNTRTNHHGNWPYESWGNGLNADPWLKVDFGRSVVVDKVKLYIRADFPHDTYWTNLTMEFSDGSSQEITLKKTAEAQEFTFPEKTVSWVRLTKFKQPTEKLGFAAVTEIEVYGKDAPAKP